MRGSRGLQRTTAPRLVQRHCESRGCNARRNVAFEQNLGADSGGSLICVYGDASPHRCDRKANGPLSRVILHAMKRSYWVSTTSANCVCMVDAISATGQCMETMVM